MPRCVWGASTGINVNSMKFKQDLFQVSQGVGESLGVRGEMMFPGIGFGIELGLYYQQQGSTLHLGDKKIWASQGYGNERIYLHNVSIPFNLKFKWTRMQGLEEYIAPYVIGGPVFDFLLGHSNIAAMKYAGGTLGLRVGGGVEIKREWQLQVAYTWGMTYSLKTVKLDQFSARNKFVSVTLARYF